MKNKKVVEGITKQLFDSKKKTSEKGEINIPIKGMSHHLHYKIGMNSSKSIIYFSVFYAFHSSYSRARIKHCIAKKMIEVKKIPSSIQMMYIGRNSGNLGITQTIPLRDVTKEEMEQKVSVLLEDIEKFWPFRY